MSSSKCFTNIVARALAVSWLCIACFGAPSHAAAATLSAPRLRQDAQALADYVAQFLKTHAAQGDALQVHAEPPRTTVAACTQLHAEMPRVLRPRTAVAVRCLAPQAWNLTVYANLTLPGAYYAAARTIAPGEALDQGDVRRVQADLLRLPAGAVTDPAQLLGRIATQRIRQGSAIRSGSLRDPGSIQRGQRVHVQARGAGFVMRGEGQALAGGAPGATIAVRMVSGAVISAFVVDATTVQVPL